MFESSMVIPAEEEELIRLEIQPVDDGVVLGFRSPIFKKFWEGLADKSEPIKTSQKWGGVRFFNIPENRIPIVRDADLRKIGEGLILPEGHVNLAFLRLVDIDKGAIVKLHGVFGFGERESFKRAFPDRTEVLYTEYLRPVQTTVVVTTRRLGK
jgi:hypothetical protein